MKKKQEKDVTVTSNEVKFKFDINHSPLKRKNMLSVINGMTPESGLNKAICYMIDSIKLTNDEIRSKLDLNFTQPNYEILNKLKEEFKKNKVNSRESNRSDLPSNGLVFESKYIKMTDEEKQKVLGRIEEESDIRKENYQVMIESIKQNMIEMLKDYQLKAKKNQESKQNTTQIKENETEVELKPRTVHSCAAVLNSFSSDTIRNKNAGRLENIRALNKKEFLPENVALKSKGQHKDLLTTKTMSRITQLKRATNIGVLSQFNHKKSSNLNSPTNKKYSLSKKMNTSQSRSSNQHSTNRSVDSRKSKQSNKPKNDSEQQRTSSEQSGIYKKKNISEDNMKQLGNSINQAKISIISNKNILPNKSSIKTNSDVNSPTNKKNSVRFDITQMNEDKMKLCAPSSFSFTILRQTTKTIPHDVNVNINEDIMPDDKPLRIRSSNISRMNKTRLSDKEITQNVLEFDNERPIMQKEKRMNEETQDYKQTFSLENFEINLTSQQGTANNSDKVYCSGSCCSWKPQCVII